MRKYILGIIILLLLTLFGCFEYQNIAKVRVKSEVKNIGIEISNRNVLMAYLKQIDYWQGSVVLKVGVPGKALEPKKLEIILTDQQQPYFKLHSKVDEEPFQSLGFGISEDTAQVFLYYSPEVYKELLLETSKRRYNLDILRAICYQQSEHAIEEDGVDDCGRIAAEFLDKNQKYPCELFPKVKALSRATSLRDV